MGQSHSAWFKLALRWRLFLLRCLKEVEEKVGPTMSVLPTLPRATEYTALVVVVSTLSDLARQRLETVIKGEYDDRYKPTFVYCLGNIFQQQLEKYGQDGM